MSEVAPAMEAPAPVAPAVESKPTDTSPDTADTSSGDGTATPSSPPEVVSEETLQALARQLEYYFSAVNLTRDTYLRTLRELNDGYVPASILANFAKVQALCLPYDSHSGVIKAATDYSDNLEVVHVDKESSKKVAEEGIHTLLAVGPKDLKPIELPVTPTPVRPTVSVVPTSPVVPSPASSGIQNTVILREVPEGVTEDDIRLLFDFEKCPPIQEVHEDLANYWFVTFNTSSRDDMMNVMLALRSKTLKGESVKSRLKSGSIPASAASTNIVIPQIYAGDRNLPYNEKNGKAGAFVNGINNNKKKGGTVQQQQAPRSPKDGKKINRRNNRRSKGEASPSVTKQISQAPPPPLVESQFPSLEAPSVVIKPQQQPAKEEDEDDKPMSSDGASTATTSTSSSVVGELIAAAKPKAPGGYAAALLKAKPPTSPSTSSTFAKETKTDNVKTTGKKTKNGNKKDTIPKVIEEKSEKKATIKVETKAMSWGGGRSFVDVIKNKENATASS